jgi:hypothetical protein
MLIDPFVTDWMDWLNVKAAHMAADAHIYLLLDGVFVPGLHRTLKEALPKDQELMLLFESLPGCSEEARDVSPLVMPYLADNGGLVRVVGRCSGWPMVSAIVTPESIGELTARLAAWCVVAVDDERFNFRFPDTRRLPGIFNALSPDQRSELAGSATAWYYIDRDGSWKALHVPQSVRPAAVSPSLDATQFSAMVDDSEADEVIMLLQDRGRQWEQPHSTIHGLVSEALQTANEASLESNLRVDWCEACIDDAAILEGEPAERLARWRAAQA